MTTLHHLPTPCLLLDRGRLHRNIARMNAAVDRHGVALRPHLKTAKSAEVARLATAGQAGGITVSTLAEAAYFLERGFRDITYAVGIVPGKLAPSAALIRRGADLKVITDSVAGAEAIIAAAAGEGVRFCVLIEIDSGQGRAGVVPESEALIAIARALAASPEVELLGVLTHAGQSYGCRSTEEIAAVAEAERAAVVAAAERLRTAGHPAPVVSVGSTPTALFARSLQGVTEARPGVYVFGDLYQEALGTCGPQDLAVSVLASVIGRHPERGRVLIDAGALALSQDHGLDRFRPDGGGYGRLRGLGLAVAGVNQEHGFVPVPDAALFERLPIGAKVQVDVNHACMTAAMYDHYQVVEEDKVVALWDRVNGW